MRKISKNYISEKTSCSRNTVIPESERVKTIEGAINLESLFLQMPCMNIV